MSDGLQAFVVAMLVAAVLTVLTAAVAFAVVRWRMRRANRLHPRVPTPVSTTWIASPSRGARLHRRLRNALLTATVTLPGGRRRPVSTGPVDDLAAELLQEAVALDHQLAMAAKAPSVARRRLLDALELQVRQVEVLARRISGLRADGARAGIPTAAALRTIEERIDTIEEARVEIAELEGVLRFTAAPNVTRRPEPPAPSP